MTAKLAPPRQLWEKIRDKRRKSWKDGQRVRVETIVRQLPPLLSDPDVIAELLYQEYCLREEEGEEPEREAFFLRFPESSQPLERLFERHRETGDSGTGYRDTIDMSAHGSTMAGLLAAELKLPDRDKLRKGEKIGRYLLIDQLGEGAMGVVFLARDTLLERPVAMKFPRFTEKEVEEGCRSRFYREARAAAAIEHPCLCPIYDIGEVDGQDYIAMSYVAGATLEETIAVGPMDVREAFQVIRDAASALDECHAHGIIHRDVKPSNIVINQRGTPVIMDFGLAAMEESSRLTTDNQVIGTLSYMSPEQLSGRVDELGPTSDVYSLGITLYEAVTGRPPFPGKYLMDVYEKIMSDQPRLPSSIVKTLDARVDEICLKAIAKSRHDRYASMAEFAAALDGYLS